MLVVSFGAAGAVATPLAADGATTASLLQEGEGNTTATPTPTANAGTDGTNDSDATAANDTNTSDGATFGAQVSSFMQTTDADAETEVEDGMFSARFERSNASERARLVRQRAAEISDRVAELREERASILGGENVTVRERAEAARLAAQSRNLADSVNQTADVAIEANVELNRTALEELRTEARNLTGPEVAELARGLVDRDDAPRRGPPEDRGKRAKDDRVEDPSNITLTPDDMDIPGVDAGNASDARNGSDARNDSDTAGGSDAGDSPDARGGSDGENESAADERNPNRNGSNGGADGDTDDTDDETVTETETDSETGTDAAASGDAGESDGDRRDA